MKFAAIAAVAMCATAPPVQTTLLKEVEAPPAGCKLVGNFEGNSALAGDAAFEQAREQARARASAAGATHIVPGKEWQSPDATVASVNAYNCK